MSKVHILDSDGNYGYNVIIHFPMTTGNNLAGFTWKSCCLAVGVTGSTVLTVGTAPGNITQDEHDQIIAGDVIEIHRTIKPGTNPSNTTVNALADLYVAECNAELSNNLKYYGHAIE